MEDALVWGSPPRLKSAASLRVSANAPNPHNDDEQHPTHKGVGGAPVPNDGLKVAEDLDDDQKAWLHFQQWQPERASSPATGGRKLEAALQTNCFEGLGEADVALLLAAREQRLEKAADVEEAAAASGGARSHHVDEQHDIGVQAAQRAYEAAQAALDGYEKQFVEATATPTTRKEKKAAERHWRYRPARTVTVCRGEGLSTRYNAAGKNAENTTAAAMQRKLFEAALSSQQSKDEQNGSEHILGSTNVRMSTLSSANVLPNELPALLRALAKGLPANSSLYSSPPLHKAAMDGAHQSADALICAGAQLNALSENRKQTALHSAVVFVHERVCERLLRAGVDATIRDSAGQTALDLAQKAQAGAEERLRKTTKQLEAMEHRRELDLEKQKSLPTAQRSSFHVRPMPGAADVKALLASEADVERRKAVVAAFERYNVEL